MMRRALVCAPHPPEHDRESGSRRLWDLVVMLQADGWQVTFLAENTNGAERTVSELCQRGVVVLDGITGRSTAAIALGDFDLAVVAFHHLADRLLPILRQLAPSMPVVVDSIDLHLLRESRQTLRPRDDDRRPSRLRKDFGARAARELNTYAAADGVMAVSAREAGLIDALLGRDGHAMVVADREDIASSIVPFADRHGVLFVGNFRHPPNGEAVDFLLDRVVPLIPPEILADHPIRLVGTALVHWLRGRPTAGMPAGVVAVGWVPSLLPYLHRSRVSVAPLLHGAGTKRKVIQALMAGLPTVTTSIGAEGLDLVDGRDVVVADDAASFAAAIQALLCDERRWDDLRRAGHAAMAERHGNETVAAQLRGMIERITGMRGDSRSAASLPAAPGEIEPRTLEPAHTRLASAREDAELALLTGDNGTAMTKAGDAARAMAIDCPTKLSGNRFETSSGNPMVPSPARTGRCEGRSGTRPAPKLSEAPDSVLVEASIKAIEHLTATVGHRSAFLALEAAGYHVLRPHFYSPIPTVAELDDRPWNGADPIGIDMRLPEQLALLDRLTAFRSEYDTFPRTGRRDSTDYFFDNGQFGGTDALVLYAMLRTLRPSLVVEVGSGYSTRLMVQAAQRNGDTKILCIEPFPDEPERHDVFRHPNPSLALVPHPVQDVDLVAFTSLEDGDVLFIDSSHVSRVGSDVNFLMFEVLPRLAKGVYVHFHDIFLPDDYPRVWITEHQRFWTEQYLLRAFMIGNAEFEVVLANAYLERRRPEALRLAFPNAPWWGGGSFWIRKRA